MTSTVPASADWSSLILHRVDPTGKEIGRGAYGRVFEVDYEGTLCAAKEVHAILLQYAQGNNLRKIIDDFLNECQIWSTLRHPCVVQFLGVYHSAMDQYRLPVIVMEKMQRSLTGLVENYDNIPLNVKLSILDEVSLGLRYLHSRNPQIVHRDLTPNNILLGVHLEAKITDLGVAKVVRSDDQKTMTQLPGTPDFMPPEALSVTPVYGPSLDVFSYGGVILNVTTQLWPRPTDLVEFNPDTGKREVVSEVKRRQRYLDKLTGDAADLKPLVMSCLNDSPRNRPPVAQVSMTIKRIKEVCSQKGGYDGMSPIMWWTEVSSDQQSQQQLLLKESTTPDDPFSGPVNIKWKEGAPAPVDCCDHQAVWLDGVVYVGGGFDPKRLLYIINCYDPVNNSWSSPIKTPYYYFAMTTLNNRLLIAGGKDKHNKTSNQIFTMDAGVLENITKMITARWSAVAAGHQGMLIITGGMVDEDMRLSSTELFDSNNHQWYTCSDLPKPHCWLQSVIIDNILYLLGGKIEKDRSGSPMVFTAPLDKLSRHQLKWRTTQDTPWGRSAPVNVNGTHLLMVGGIKKIRNEFPRTSDIYKLNKVTDSWEAMGHIPSARCSSAAVSTAENKVIVIGGRDDKGWATNTVWIGSCEPQ